MSYYLQNLDNRHHSVKNTEGDPDHEYIDCVICNNFDKNTLKPQPIIFNSIKNSNIVDKCDDYYISIIRWSLHTSLPVIIPEIDFTDTNPTPPAYTQQTIYKLNIGVGFSPYEQNAFTYVNNGTSINFLQEDKSLPQPTLRPSSLTELYKDEYYYIRNIQHFLDMVNVAIVVQLSNVKLNFSGSSAQNAMVQQSVFPKFVWDANSGKIQFLCGFEFMFDNTDSALSVPKLFLSMNSKLFNLFDTFQNVIYSRRNLDPLAPPQNDGTDVVLVFPYNYGVNSHQESINNISKEIFINTQQSSSVPSWSPVESLVFNTYKIPVHNSLVSSPDFLGQELDSTLSQNTLANVLTDFQLPLTRGDEYSNAMNYYIPNSEYRLFDLNSNVSLSTLNITVNWIDTVGGIHPVYMKYLTNASIKLLLRKKKF